MKDFMLHVLKLFGVVYLRFRIVPRLWCVWLVGVNAACRITGASKNTALKLLADAGEACAAYQDDHLRNIKSKRI